MAALDAENSQINPFDGWKIADEDIQIKEQRDHNDFKRTRIHLAPGRGYCDVVSVDHDVVSTLIAAAPDLLAALQEVVLISDRKHDAWDRAYAAIAKATTLELSK